MKLPAIFKQDIQSKNIQLIPLLIIERDDNWGDWSYNSTSIFLSTHDITVQRSDDNSTGLPYLNQGQGSWDDGMYFSPLLLDNPVISEKIDVENRKYTISKCTFKISNNPYNGQRFSDILREDSLIGKKVNFVYKSINSSFPLGSMFLDATGNSSWGDLYDDNEYLSPTFYFGEIRDVKHNNEVVTITAEDLGSSFLHQELPKNSLPSNSTIIESNRGAKIPMVYGYVPRSPVVMGANNKIYADSRPIQGWFRNDINNPNRYNYPFDSQDFGALFINIDDHHCCVADTIKYKLADNNSDMSAMAYFNFSGYENEPTQVEYVDDDVYDSTQVAKLVGSPLLSKKVLQLMVAYKPSKISLVKRHPSMSWNSSDDYPNEISLGDSDLNWSGEDNLLEQEFEHMTDSDFSSTTDEAESDTSMSNQVSAMVNSVTHSQLADNFYKHTLFRFTIDTEPPIEYINRGGISRQGNWGTYWHWISFGHWVMPEQSVNTPDDSHNIYTYARRGANDDTYLSIRTRHRNASSHFVATGQESNDETYLTYYDHYMANEDLASHTTFGNSICLADILRFSNYHTDATYADINPEQVNWHSFEANAKSPLQFYDASTIDEAGGYGISINNPFAKFTNKANEGKYVIDLGIYGYSKNSSGVVSYNFDYFGRLKGWLPEVNCLSVCDTKVTFKDMYGSVGGRVDSDNNLIKHPSDIIADIFVNELGYSANKIDVESLELTKGVNDHGNYEFCFTQKDAINSKDLIEDIARSTFIFPRIGFDGTLKFPQIKQRYEQADLDNSIVIDDLDIISYSYNLTKRQELRTGTELKYNYDYHTENYFGDSETNNYNGSSIYNMSQVSENELSFNGLNNIEDNIQEFESKYMRTELNYDSDLEANHQINTIKNFQKYSTQHYRNRHLIIKCKLPLKYLNIDVGEYVRFSKLIDGVKAYGIDYSKTELLNNQYLYPLFMCTNIKKTIEYVEIECLQLHHLRNADGLHGSPIAAWFNIDDDTIPSVYYEPGQTVGEQEEEDEVIDDDTGEGDDTEEETDYNLWIGLHLDPYHRTEFQFYDFYNHAFHAGFPYQDSSIGLRMVMQDLDESEESTYVEFGDPLSAINLFFTPDRVQFKILNQNNFNSIQSFNDLLPAEYTTTTEENIDYIMFELFDRSLNNENQVSSREYVYRLKNIQTEIGEPIQLGWVYQVIEADWYYEHNHQQIHIYSLQAEDDWRANKLMLYNYTNYTIKLSLPTQIHRLDDGILASEYSEYPLGDVDLDYNLSVMDIVKLVNHILGNNLIEDEQSLINADFNEDSDIDITDVISMVNQLLGYN